MKNNKTTNKNRRKLYGKYSDTIEARSRIMEILIAHNLATGEDIMTHNSQTAISDLILKLVRIAGSPTHIDSYHDLAGYANLIKNELIEESK